jgi:hypothetical protein
VWNDFSSVYLKPHFQVSALGDRDTTCAIVGGIVALKVGYAGLPLDWRSARESLSDWEAAEVNWD